MAAKSSSPATFTLPTALNPPLNGREAVADALYRAALGWDTNDISLLESAFTRDSIFEANGVAMDGIPKIIPGGTEGLARVFTLDTSHMVTNVRVSMGDDKEEGKASLTATVLSQHYAQGEGFAMKQGKKMLLAGSLYFGDLVKGEEGDGGDGLWRFKFLKAKSLWTEGDWGVVGVPVQGME